MGMLSKIRKGFKRGTSAVKTKRADIHNQRVAQSWQVGSKQWRKQVNRKAKDMIKNKGGLPKASRFAQQEMESANHFSALKGKDAVREYTGLTRRARQELARETGKASYLFEKKSLSEMAEELKSLKEKKR